MLDAIQRLAEILIEMPGPITREKVIAKRKSIKKARKRDPFEAANSPSLEEPKTGNSGVLISDPQLASAEEASLFSVVLIDLRDPNDVARLAKDYVHGGEPAALKAGERMSFDPTVVIILRLGDIYAVNAKLSFWRKGKFDRIFLFSQPITPEITNEIAIVVCTKNEIFDQLFFRTMESDPLKVCRAVLENVDGPRLHLFARGETAGWESVLGENNWSTE